MAKLPETILEAWANKEGACIMTTVGPAGIPNSIYATCVSLYQQENILVANNYFNKTAKNMAKSCPGSFLFMTKEGKSYQLKGTYTHFTEGEYFEDMKKWNPAKHPGVGVAVLTVTEIYSGSQKIDL